MRAIPLLFLAATLPVSLCAQTGASTITQNASASTTSRKTANDSKDAQVSSLVSGDDMASPIALGQQSKSPSQQQPKPNKPKPTSDLGRPPIEGSMVGYIDNAVVGSQVRLRFDAGFDNNRPDRAEFFYAACGCNNGLGKPFAAGPQPGLVLHLNFQQLYMRGEYAPVKRFSVVVDVPFRWVQPQQFVPITIPSTGGFGNQAGISDVQAGFKLALLASDQNYFTLQFLANFPSGDSSKGLGTNHYGVQPSLLYFQKVTDRFSFEAQLGDTHPFENTYPGFPGDVFTYGIGPSYVLYKGERLRVAPVIELVGWRVFGGYVTDGDLLAVVGSDGTNIVNLKAGIRTSMGNHNSVYVGYGQALTHDMWYKHIVRLEYRYTF